uniref:Uncharacterized protein n=1 Tax=Leersia perrieri TaxID=77586 RepID=A0A0D9VDQ4_9ORYZ
MTDYHAPILQAGETIKYDLFWPPLPSPLDPFLVLPIHFRPAADSAVGGVLDVVLDPTLLAARVPPQPRRVSSDTEPGLPCLTRASRQWWSVLRHRVLLLLQQRCRRGWRGVMPVNLGGGGDLLLHVHLAAAGVAWANAMAPASANMTSIHRLPELQTSGAADVRSTTRTAAYFAQLVLPLLGPSDSRRNQEL